MRTGQTYHTREIETMLRSKQGQAKLRSTLEQTRLLPIDFLGEDGAPESAQQILEQIKNQARQEAAEILAQQKSPSPPREPVARSPRRTGRVPRGVIAACLCLLLCCFWVSKPGIAFAQHFQEIIAKWRDGILNIAQTMPSNDLPNELNYADLPATFASPEDAARYLQRHVAVIQHETLTLESIEVYAEEPLYIMLWSTYKLADNRIVVIWHTFYDSTCLTAGHGAPAEEPVGSYTLPNGEKMLYGNTGYGNAYGIVVCPYEKISIEGESMDATTLYAFIETIDFVEP